MKIREISIIQFGKLKGVDYTLGDGMTVVFGRNESGKSTLLAFIKFVLYGLARKTPNTPVGERERALSWETGTAAGSLTVEDVDGKLYRIERIGRESARGAYSDRVRILDAESGEEVLSGEVPGEHFLGIPAQAYDSMCNIKQLEAVLVNGEAVKGVIDNLLSSGDESTSVQNALKLLDTERRRLLHTNGRGGLVYESEIAVDTLRSELRTAIVQEGELIKNRNELEKLEVSFAEVEREFETSKHLCDVHDDIVRLNKFKDLSELKARLSGERERLRELGESAVVSPTLSSYEAAARLSAAADSLERAAQAVCATEGELEAASRELSEVSDAGDARLAELIDEHASPRGAVSYFEAKRKKRSTSSFLCGALGATGGVLAAFAFVLAIAMNNLAGGATVAFLAIVLGAAAALCHRKAKDAAAELDEFCRSLYEKYTDVDPEELLGRLEAFCENRTRRTRASNNAESARFRLSVARDTLGEERERCADLLLSVGVVLDADADAVETIRLTCAEMTQYLASRSELEGLISRDEAVVGSLERELLHFNENDIRKRITPELVESLGNTSFEELKQRRDAAFKRMNGLSQYRSAIEQNLASADKRRSSAEIFPELEEATERLDKLNMRLCAVRLAAESLDQASKTLKRDLTPRIRARAEENLSRMTGGKYTELYIGDGLDVSLLAEGEVRRIEALSRGSLDVAYLAVRLALVETLMGDSLPPMFMDESLSQLDAERATAVVRAAADYSSSAQCLLLTCRADDLDLVRSIVPDSNIIEL